LGEFEGRLLRIEVQDSLLAAVESKNPIENNLGEIGDRLSNTEQ